MSEERKNVNDEYFEGLGFIVPLEDIGCWLKSRIEIIDQENDKLFTERLFLQQLLKLIVDKEGKEE